MNQKLDRSILLVIVFFLGIGLVQTYSSSFIFALERYGDGLYIVKRQAVFTILAALAFFLGSRFSINSIKKYTSWMWALVGCLLILTYIPSIGVKVGGAQRWIQLPFGVRFEPSELMKVILPFVIAKFSLKTHSDKKLIQIMQVMFILTPIFLLLNQPDFGNFVLCVSLLFLMAFSFGLNWKYVLGALTLAIPAFYVLIVRVPYRMARVAAFIDPWADQNQKGFQVIQSMLSFSSGKLFGEGLGQSQGKLFFLPEAHTDFTLAVLGEETGFIGYFVVLFLFGLLILKGFQVSMEAKDEFVKIASLGWTLLFSLSVFVNIGVVLGLLPTKGLTLPFLSYGGSSLIMTCFGLGLLLSMDRTS